MDQTSAPLKNDFFASIYQKLTGRTKEEFFNANCSSNGKSDIEQAFKIFELPDSSDQTTVKSKYRELARIWHPDKNPNNPEAHQQFIEINNAYQVLMIYFSNNASEKDNEPEEPKKAETDFSSASNNNQPNSVKSDYDEELNREGVPNSASDATEPPQKNSGQTSASSTFNFSDVFRNLEETVQNLGNNAKFKEEKRGELQQKAITVLSKIEILSNTTSSHNELLLNAATKMANLLKEPTETNAAEFNQIALNIHEIKSPAWKKLAGAMLVLLGAIITSLAVVSGIGVLFLSGGAAIAAAGGVAICGGLLGSSALSKGISLFSHKSKLDQLSKDMSDLSQTVPNEP